MLGIIGGTGLYKLDSFTLSKEIVINTPFGSTSGPIAVGKIANKEVAFLARHGAKHQLIPSEVNYRANIWALKKIGVVSILGVSAVGSLALELAPSDLAAPTQYIDFTRGKRDHTFFGDGIVGHIASAEPVCPGLHSKIISCIGIENLSAHANAVYGCVEGPRLGTRAESKFLKNAGATIVGMTNIPEVFLAREAQICYATLAVVTDYDSWLEDPKQHATTEMVISNYMKNLGRIQELLPKLVESYNCDAGCSCRHSLAFAILTPQESLSPQKREMLDILRT